MKFKILNRIVVVAWAVMSPFVSIAQTERTAGDPVVFEMTAPRSLPFSLNLRNGPAPQTLEQLADDIYRSLPEEHRRFIATFLGVGNYRQERRRHRAFIYFRDQLYAREVFSVASRHWGLASTNNPLAGQITCAGEQLPFYLMLHAGFQHVSTLDLGSQRVLWDRFNALQEAYNASRRLFRICDTRLSPSRD